MSQPVTCVNKLMHKEEVGLPHLRKITAIRAQHSQQRLVIEVLQPFILRMLVIKHVLWLEL